MLKSQGTSAQKFISKEEGQGGGVWSEAVTASQCGEQALSPTWPCWVGQVELSLVGEASGFTTGLSIVSFLKTLICPPGPSISH